MTGSAENIKNPNGFERFVTAELRVDFHKVGGRTVLGRSYHRTPLKIAKTFPNDDGSLAVCAMDCTPGILGGDRYQTACTLASGTHVFMTNQTFTKVHPARGNAESILEQRMQIGTNAVLEYAMEPTMLYKDARFRTDTTVHMDKGSAFIFHDIVCAGRVSRGEIFQFESFRSKADIIYDQELVYCNQLCIEPLKQPLQVRGVFEHFTHFGNLVVINEKINESIVDGLRTHLLKFPGQADVWFAVSRTYKHGLVLSGLAEHAWLLSDFFRFASRFMKAEIVK